MTPARRTLYGQPAAMPRKSAAFRLAPPTRAPLTFGTANLLTRTTGILAVGFFITSLFLSWLAGYERKPTSIMNGTSAPVSQPGGLTPPTSGGLLDSLKKADEQQAPAGPQAPRSQ